MRAGSGDEIAVVQFTGEKCSTHTLRKKSRVRLTGEVVQILYCAARPQSLQKCNLPNQEIVRIWNQNCVLSLSAVLGQLHPRRPRADSGRVKVGTGEQKSERRKVDFSSPTFLFARSNFPLPHYLPLGLRGRDNSKTQFSFV